MYQTTNFYKMSPITAHPCNKSTARQCSGFKLALTLKKPKHLIHCSLIYLSIQFKW